jgi:peptide/nickel transport system substrate-binding protein
MRFFNFVIHVWQKSSFREKGIFIFCSLAIISGLIWFGTIILNKITVFVPREGGTLTLGLVGHISYLNPILSQSNDCDRDLIELIYNGLYKIDGQGDLEPSLAEKTEISPDGKTYTVFLKDNVLWHDGLPFTADDVIFTIETIQDPKIKSPLSLNWGGVVVEKLSNSVIRFNLKNPYKPFLQNLTLKIIPKHIWENIKPEDIVHTEYNIKPIGTGSYLFDNLDKSSNGKISGYSLVANDNSFEGIPKINRLIFRFYDDSQTAKEALLKNEVEAISPILIKDHKFFENKKDYQIFSLYLPRYYAIFFNLNNNLLSSKDFRQALNLAIDKSSLVNNILNQQAFALTDPISPSFWSYQKFDAEYNPTKALEIINKLKNTASGNKSGPKELKFTLSLPDNPELVEVAKFLINSWKAIDVEVELQILPLIDLEKNVIQTRSYNALLFGEIISQNPDLFSFWHSSQITDPGLNLSAYKNPDLDKLLEETRQISDKDRRLENIKLIQTILVADKPAIFLYNPYYLYLLPRRIQGMNIKYANLSSERWSDVENWFIYTKRKFR